MKKLIVALLVVVMVASLSAVLVACVGDTTSFNADGQFKVGAIYITSQNDTAGYTYAHHTGITTAMKALGLDTKTQLVIQDNVAEEAAAVKTAIDTLVGQGCDMIIGISFGYIDAMEEKAKEYPNVIFSHATGYKSNETNFNNYFGRIYQARYLSGVAAGLKSLQTGNNNVGYVSAYTTEYAETASGINAFTLGVQAVNPKATIYVKSLGEWGNETNEYAYAESLIKAQGCGVIAQHCDSAQPQKAAENNGVFGCGYNSDMTKDAPNAHLTATIWHWDVYYKAAIAAAQEGPAKFIEKVGSVYYKGLSDGLVGVSAINEDTCAPNTQKAIDAVTALIKSGEWDVFSGKTLTINANGEITAQTEAPIMIAIEAQKDDSGNVIQVQVNKEAPEVTDAIITGSMNYLVKGIVLVK